MSLKIDTEFKNLIPPLSDEEYSQLEENIRKEGCRDSLVIWQGTIVDGHNRYRICTENNIPYKTTEKEFKDREEAIEWIILNQFGRRNLPPYERARLALRLEPIIAERAKEKQIDEGKTLGGTLNQKSDKGVINTSKELAKAAGVSHDTIHRVKIIEKEGSDDLREKLQKGEISVNKAYKQTKNTQTTKVCKKCGEEKPVAEFYEGKSRCKNCVNQNKVPVYKDFRGNVYKVTDEVKELARLHEADIVKSMYDQNKVIILTSDDLYNDLESFTNYFIRNAKRCVQEHENVEVTEENNKKIKAILSEAEMAIKELKGCFIYE